MRLITTVIIRNSMIVMRHWELGVRSFSSMGRGHINGLAWTFSWAPPQWGVVVTCTFSDGINIQCN